MGFWFLLFWTSFGLMAYGYVCYPLLAVVASWLPFRRQELLDLPRVTLLIPAYNEETVIRDKLENALAIDYPPGKLEIIVASDGSTDRTNELAAGFSSRGVRLLEFPRRRGKASVLNDAVASAMGNVICLCDANVMFAPGALRKLVAPLVDPCIGAVCGDVQLASEQSNFGTGERAYYCIERSIQLGESRLGSVMGVDGGMYTLRKELYQPLPEDTILDDFVISMRVIRQGYRIIYVTDALAMENGTPLAMQEFRRRTRVAAGAVQSLKRGEVPPLRRPVEFLQFTSHKLLRWLSPLLLSSLLISNVPLANKQGLYRLTLAGQSIIYFAAAAALISLRLRNTRLGGIAFYFTMSQIAMAVGLLKGLLNRQSVSWTKADRQLLSPDATLRYPSANG